MTLTAVLLVASTGSALCWLLFRSANGGRTVDPLSFAVPGLGPVATWAFNGVWAGFCLVQLVVALLLLRGDRR